MSDRDAEAFDHYDDVSRREPALGPPGQRPERALTRHVPVRFPASTVETVRELAKADGRSVSAWIRRIVEQAVTKGAAPDLATATETDTQAADEQLQRDL